MPGMQRCKPLQRVSQQGVLSCCLTALLFHGASSVGFGERVQPQADEEEVSLVRCYPDHILQWDGYVAQDWGAHTCKDPETVPIETVQECRAALAAYRHDCPLRGDELTKEAWPAGPEGCHVERDAKDPLHFQFNTMASRGSGAERHAPVCRRLRSNTSRRIWKVKNSGNAEITVVVDPTLRNYSESKAFCRSLGFSIASIHDDDDQEATVRRLLCEAHIPMAYVGAGKVELTWADGHKNQIKTSQRVVLRDCRSVTQNPFELASEEEEFGVVCELTEKRSESPTDVQAPWLFAAGAGLLSLCCSAVAIAALCQAGRMRRRIRLLQSMQDYHSSPLLRDDLAADDTTPPHSRSSHAQASAQTRMPDSRLPGGGGITTAASGFQDVQVSPHLGDAPHRRERVADPRLP
mmetsp:Transcript_9919/g.22548  ORF Transcript_9919/g.22548 Transcript_9919/m.22548 type:complete len:407 (+) Transcript_9919:101-1321(+)